MPITKQKLIRFQALDRCFRNRTRRYYINDLHHECNSALEQKDCAHVSIRTIKNDINEIETTYNTNISRTYDGTGRAYYRYESPTFSIEKAPLTDDELDKLKDIVLMLSRFRGMPQFGWMDETLTKIQTKMHIEGHTESIIGFESNDDLKGLEYIEPLFEYISNQQSILLTYKPFNLEQITWKLHPYYLKQYNSRWFLFALNDADHTIINAALDRIISIQPATCKYIPNQTIDFTEYFDDVIGVTIPKDQQIENIIIRCTGHRFPYIISKPLHHTQTIIDKQQRTISIKVIPNNELIALLLNFGDDIDVLQPTTVRNAIIEKITSMQKKYTL